MRGNLQEENTKLFGFKGVIGRHNFFFNEVIIFFIALPFILPYIICLFSLTEYTESGQLFEKCPLFLNICSIFVLFGTAILNLSNIWRRLKDIIFDMEFPIQAIAAFFIILFDAALLVCIPAPAILVLTISFPLIVLYIILFFKEGQGPVGGIKITQRSDFIWLHKNRQQLLLTYPIICILLISTLFIGHKTQDNSQIYPEINLETNSLELENQTQTIFTLETKNKTRE